MVILRLNLNKGVYYIMKFVKSFAVLTFAILMINIQMPLSLNFNQNEKHVYLTFDDGPTAKNTPLLLDELRNLNLPATFFVVGKLVNENPKVLQRIIDENHAIGLHTMSHNKNKCYLSTENFINENIELKNLLEKEFNVTTNILRFPFGSHNSYLRINKPFINKLHENNFKIYDWHIDTFDAVQPDNDPCTILQICKNQFQKRFSNNKDIIILMHTNTNNIHTIKSLKLIRDYFLNLGYEFSTLNESTEEIYYTK